jgi:hypothetical protein
VAGSQHTRTAGLSYARSVFCLCDASPMMLFAAPSHSSCNGAGTCVVLLGVRGFGCGRVTQLRSAPLALQGRRRAAEEEGGRGGGGGETAGAQLGRLQGQLRFRGDVNERNCRGTVLGLRYFVLKMVVVVWCCPCGMWCKQL